MGNYNCQECITKEMNFMNELLIDTNLLSPEEQIEGQKTYESKIKKYKKIKPKEEDIKKLTENKDLLEDKKKFVEKTINKNSLEKYIKNNNNKVKKEKENDNIPDVKITTLEPLKENNNDITINIEYELNNENENQKDIEIKKDENENKQKSKKFDIETYEPINDNNNIDELFEKKERGNEPEDILDSDFRKPIIPKVNKEDINDEIGPRDSKRKKQNNNNNNKKNEKNKTKVPLNKGEIYNELHIKDSNDIVNEKINNYDRNAITLGPYLNDIEEIKNSNTTGPVINSNNNQENNNDNIIDNQQTPQKDLEATLSERDNPLLIGYDKGNYLEKQYEAYQNQMRYIYDE